MFKLTIIGSSCAGPNRDAATSSYLLQTDGSTVLLECGHGAVGKLLKYATAEQLAGVVISHMHPDHCFDLVALRSHMYRRDLPSLKVYLPEGGVQSLHALAAAFNLGSGYFEKSFELVEYGCSDLFTVGDLMFRAASVDHGLPANSFLIYKASKNPVTHGNARLFYSGDTAYFGGLASLATDCDILLAEVTDGVSSPTGRRTHMNSVEVGLLATLVTAPRVVLTHYDDRYEELILVSVSLGAPASIVSLAVEGQNYVLES